MRCLGERAFRIAAPRAWYSLPSDVKKANVQKATKDFPVLQTLRRHFNYFYRFIFLCKQLVGLRCKLPCQVMIIVIMSPANYT